MEHESDNNDQPTYTIEHKGDNEVIAENIVVPMSQKEFDTLDELGGDDETVLQWLKDHGLDGADRFVVRIEGSPDFVVDATTGDFLTTDREATVALNEAQFLDAQAAEAARALLAIESELDVHSAEIAEEESEHEPRRITEDEIRDLGDDGLGSSGVEEPAEEETEAMPVESSMMTELAAIREREARAELERRIPKDELQKIDSYSGYLFERAILAYKYANEPGAQGIQQDSDTDIIRQMMKYQEGAKNGTMHAETTVFLEGLGIGAIQDASSLDRLIGNVMNNELIGAEERSKVGDAIDQLQRDVRSMGPTGNHFMRFSSDLDQQLYTMKSEGLDVTGDRAYLLLKGLSVGIMMRTGLAGISAGREKIYYALEEMKKIKK